MRFEPPDSKNKETRSFPAERPFEPSNFKGRETRLPAETPDANLLCMVLLDPVADRQAELTKEAEKKFPKGFKDDEKELWVKDRLAMEFPGKCKELTAAERKDLTDILLRRANLFWQGILGPMDVQDEAVMNVLRFYPTMPDEIRALAEKRELSRIKEPGKQGRPALDLEDNATLDAWLRLPKGTEKERAALAEKFVKWAKIERGDNIPETVEEKAERLYPGSKDIQKLAVRQLKGERLSADEKNLLAVWEKNQFPYSDAWRNDEWLAMTSGWKDPKANAKFFDTVREAKLHKLEGRKDTATEDDAVLEAYNRYSTNPRGFELYLRDRMAPTMDVGKWKTLTDAERKELESWETYNNVWPVSHDEARRLNQLDPKKLTALQLKTLQKLRGLANSKR